MTLSQLQMLISRRWEFKDLLYFLDARNVEMIIVSQYWMKHAEALVVTSDRGYVCIVESEDNQHEIITDSYY